MAAEFDALLSQITAALEPFEHEYQERMIGRTTRIHKELHDFKASAEAKAMWRDAFTLYARYHAICGGKAWFQRCNGSLTAAWKLTTEFCQKQAAGRNATLAAKLDRVGVTSVLSSDFARTTDGFQGVYTVETDKGRKVITINVIVAGGYNIQCAHFRVLVKVK